MPSGSNQKGPRMRKLQPSKAPIKTIEVGEKIGEKLPLGRVMSPVRAVTRPLGRFVPAYFRNSWAELRQVTWPNRRETWRLTLAVFIFAIVFGLAILGVDRLLDLIFKNTVLK